MKSKSEICRGPSHPDMSHPQQTAGPGFTPTPTLSMACGGHTTQYQPFYRNKQSKFIPKSVPNVGCLEDEYHFRSRHQSLRFTLTRRHWEAKTLSPNVKVRDPSFCCPHQIWSVLQTYQTFQTYRSCYSFQSLPNIFHSIYRQRWESFIQERGR